MHLTQDWTGHLTLYLEKIVYHGAKVYQLYTAVACFSILEDYSAIARWLNKTECPRQTVRDEWRELELYFIHNHIDSCTETSQMNTVPVKVAFGEFGAWLIGTINKVNITKGEGKKSEILQTSLSITSLKEAKREPVLQLCRLMLGEKAHVLYARHVIDKACVYEKPSDHDFTKDAMYMLCTIVLFRGQYVEQQKQKYGQDWLTEKADMDEVYQYILQTVNTHVTSEPHHPQYEVDMDTYITDANVRECALDCMTRAAQFEQQIDAHKIMNKFKPVYKTASKDITDHRHKLFFETLNVYKDMVMAELPLFF